MNTAKKDNPVSEVGYKQTVLLLGQDKHLVSGLKAQRRWGVFIIDQTCVFVGGTPEREEHWQIMCIIGERRQERRKMAAD